MTVTEEEISKDLKFFLQSILDLHEERALTYRIFESGFIEYLETGPQYDFEWYKKLVHEVTDTFQKLNIEVRDNMNSIKGLEDCQSKDEILDNIESILKSEKEKLELTAKIQLMKKSKDAQDEIDEDDFRNLNNRIAVVIGEINEKYEDLRYEMD